MTTMHFQATIIIYDKAKDRVEDDADDYNSITSLTMTRLFYWHIQNQKKNTPEMEQS